MRMKTIEEIKDAVLAECERLCPASTKGFWHSISASIKLMHHPTDNHRWSIDLFDGDGHGEWLCSICWIGDESEPHEIDTAYRLFGLEAAHAVEAMTKEKDHWQADCGRYIEQLTDEEVKNHHLRIANAALLKTLKSIRTTISSLGSGYDEMDEFVCGARAEIDSALEAHKKGGQNG